jgi:AcrR family transcriptional regulator
VAADRISGLVALLLTDRSNIDTCRSMARPKEFDREQALAAALAVFRQHGFAGSSARMLTDAMKIGRQSAYDTFGDKWRLYCEALRSYAADETSAHIAALGTATRAVDGIRVMIERVVVEARTPCLGIGSVCEFGEARAELNEIRLAAGAPLHAAIARSIRAAQADGDIGQEFNADDLAAFLVGNIAGIRIAGRSGAGEERLRAMGDLTLRALR